LSHHALIVFPNSVPITQEGFSFTFFWVHVFLYNRTGSFLFVVLRGPLYFSAKSTPPPYYFSLCVTVLISDSSHPRPTSDALTFHVFMSRYPLVGSRVQLRDIQCDRSKMRAPSPPSPNRQAPALFGLLKTTRAGRTNLHPPLGDDFPQFLKSASCGLSARTVCVFFFFAWGGFWSDA